MARGHELALWELRATHELGTIEMFERAGDERLLRARAAAVRIGALSTAAVVELQLAAIGICRFDIEAAREHAQSALAASERLGLDQVRAKALCMLAEAAALAGDRVDLERFADRAAAASGDPALVAFTRGARGEGELLHGDPEAAVEWLDRATTALASLPHAEPACFRALWPVLLASRGDRRAGAAVVEARRLGVGAFRLNRGLLGYAEAILSGVAGDASGARRRASACDPDFVNCQTWADVARTLVAESAASTGWAEPGPWLQGAGARLEEHGLGSLADRARRLDERPDRWRGLRVTAREAEVLILLTEGLSNKEIAARLGVSPRTIEKHVEALLRKADARSRTQLVAKANALATPSIT